MKNSIIQKKINTTVLIGLLLVCPYALAGGLSKATDAANDLQTWIYGITSIACAINVSFLSIMAKMGKRHWNDVIMSIGQTALAGSAIVVVTWAYGLFS